MSGSHEVCTARWSGGPQKHLESCRNKAVTWFIGSKLRYFFIKSGSVWEQHNLSAASNKSLPSWFFAAWLLLHKLGSSQATVLLRVNLGKRRTRPSAQNLS